ncbi:hypothetical protein EU528_15050 [Candidatus Thorarchaeota archaeon]|nr:MAG: hypothetical protein EU528_15050 [Candidatus Thorarchaeota archaeon]
MQYDIVTMLAANLVFSIQAAPAVVIVATLIRSLMLLSGKKRAFRSWTRNALLSALTIIFLPGMIINTGVRYAICSLFRIDLEGVAAGSTYAELNLFLKVDSPPRVAVLISALFVSTLVSIFIGFSLLFLPVVLLAGMPVILLCWYLSLSVLFNSSLRGGDVSLLGAALRKHPGKGIVELILALSLLIVFYSFFAWGIGA